MLTTPTPRSSSIGAVGYDAQNNELQINFKTGGKYIYEKVPEHIYADFMAASSMGRYFWANIRSFYNYKRV